MATCIRRREFIATLGGAAAWPLVARAQQPAMPVIGFLGTERLESAAARLHAFHQGLNETSYVEGRNVMIEFIGHPVRGLVRPPKTHRNSVSCDGGVKDRGRASFLCPTHVRENARSGA